MSEIALQGLLDRTKADEQDEDAMDMTVINGIRMSKYDKRALKVGQRVTPELHDALTKFNQNFIGANSVFPVKNGAPRILEQFRGPLHPRIARSIHYGQQAQEIAHGRCYLLPR
jgi:hypothetical protein